MGPLNVPSAVFPNVGQMDIGGPVGIGGIPTGVVIVGNGIRTTGLNPLFVLGASGLAMVSFSTPGLPPGIFAAFQTITYNTTLPGAFPRLSNAVELTIM